MIYVTTSSCTQQGKLLVFQFLFHDLIKDLFCKSVNMVLYRRWLYRNPHLTVSDEEKRQIYEKRTLKSGALQVFMHRGVNGMASTVNILLCTTLPRFVTLILLTQSTVFKEIDIVMQLICILQFFLIVIASVITMVAEVNFRRRLVNSQADLDRHLSECLDNHDLITYLDTEEYEYEISKVNIKNYARNWVSTKISSASLTLFIYLVSNLAVFVALFRIDMKRGPFQKNLFVAFYNVSTLVERQTTFFSFILIKFRKAILDSSFALEFMEDIDKFDIIADVPQYHDSNKRTRESVSYRTTSTEGNDMSTKENEPFETNEIAPTLTQTPIQYEYGLKYKQDRVILEWVGFAVKQADIPIFKPFSHKILRGQKVLIKGRNGIGKTSILRAAFNFVDYTGLMLLYGNDIRSYSKKDMARYFSICTQKAHIFNKTIRENLEYGNNADFSTLTQICDEFEITRIANRFQFGLETTIQTNPLTISDGEEKKIAIARTILRDAHIYWFDEPTANLDIESERRIVQRIVQLNATVICILHSDQFDSLFDSILYIED